MNIVNIIIIISVLISLAVIIFVIIRSLKSVDDTIIEELKTKKTVKKKSILRKVKGKMVWFFEIIVKKISQIIQKLHSWIIKVKKREKSDVVKAKDELVIDEPEIDKVKAKKIEEKININEPESKSVFIEKEKNDKTDGDEPLNNYFNNKSENKEELEINTSDDKPQSIDAVVGDENNNIIKEKSAKNVAKKGLMKSLFRKRKSEKNKTDMIVDTGSGWSLGGKEIIKNNDKKEKNKVDISINPVGEKFKGANTSRDIKTASEDDVIGVDRKILEKKILQKIDKNPKNIDNYKELGSLYIKMEKLDDALEVFSYVLSVAPRDVEALNKQNKIKLLKKLQK